MEMLKYSSIASKKMSKFYSTGAGNKLTIKDMPRSNSVSIFGKSLDLIMSGGGHRLHEFIDKRHRELGDTFVEKIGTAEIVFTSDPPLMKSLFMNLEGKYPRHILPDPWVLYEKIHGPQRGLFFMDGTEWMGHRKVMNRHLLQNDPEAWLNAPMQETVSDFIGKLKVDVENNKAVNLESDLYNLSIRVVINTLIGSRSSIISTRFYDEIFYLFADSVKRIFKTTTKLYVLPLQLSYYLNLKVWKDFEDSVNMTLKIVHGIIANILANKKYLGQGLMVKLYEDNMDEDILIRIIADFIIAAGDTTSYTTLWTLLLLAQNQKYIASIRNNELNIIKNIIRESMRLYPVAPFLTRILPNQCNFGKYWLDTGTPIVASIYTSGRDPRYFSKPDEFLPHRWDKEARRSIGIENHEPSASLPFAMGSRSCVGKKIAMLQLNQVIREIVHNFDFRCEGGSAEVKAKTEQILVPDRPLKLKFTITSN